MPNIAYQVDPNIAYQAIFGTATLIKNYCILILSIVISIAFISIAFLFPSHFATYVTATAEDPVVLVLMATGADQLCQRTQHYNGLSASSQYA